MRFPLSSEVPRSAAVLAAAGAFLAAPQAHACSLCPIDDFEAGAFSFSGTTYQQQSAAIPGWQSHSVAATRIITLEPYGGYSQAFLNSGTSLDDYATLIVPTSGRCRIRWDWGFPVDITQGGAVDCVDLVVDGEGGAEVLLEIGDASGNTNVSRWLAGADGPETVTWDLGQFLGSALVDITQAVYMELTFYAPPSGSSFPYLVYDVRFGQAATGPADFQGNFVATQTPPVPTPPLLFTLYDAATVQPLYQAQASIADALTDAQTVPPLGWTWTQTQIPGYDVAQMTLQWNDPFVVETDFDLSFDAVTAPGTVGLVDLVPPDPVYTAESIALNFPVMTFDPLGTPVGTSNTWLTLDFDGRQLGSLEFQGVTVTENVAATPGATDGFTLHFRMAYSGMNTPDYQAPILHATWISDWAPWTPTGAPQPAAAGTGDERLRLTAVPSVTSAGTEIRASRPLARAARLQIHDVTGRRIRSLPVPAGASAVRWDGRTSDGRPTAAGVYFVRLDDGSADATRVVKVGAR